MTGTVAYRERPTIGISLAERRPPNHKHKFRSQTTISLLVLVVKYPNECIVYIQA